MKASTVSTTESGGAALTSRVPTASWDITKRPTLIRHGRRLYRRLAEDADVAGLAAVPEPVGPVQEADLTGLPEPAQRYLRRAGAVGREPDSTARSAGHAGEAA